LPVPRSRAKRLLLLSLVVLVAGTGLISWRMNRNRWRDAVLLRDYNQVISRRGIVMLEQPILTFKGHTRKVTGVAFSPDGTRIASAGGDGDATVRIWKSGTAELLMTLSGHDRGVYNLAFTPDGKILASAGHDHTLRLWDAETGKLLRMIDGLEIHVMGVAFSPDGGRVATGDGNGAKIWQVETGQE
jgi:WD40 repeat protein